MMKKILVFCATYYQLIVAIQLRITVYKNAQVSLWLSNHPVRVDNVASALKKTGVFSDVRVVRAKEDWLAFTNMGIIEKLKETLECDLGKSFFPDIEAYDEVVFFNPSKTIYKIADALYLAGKRDVVFRRMEEGLATCSSNHSHYFKGESFIIHDAIRRFTRRPIVSKMVNGFYCFIPELCDADFPTTPLRIPSLSSSLDELLPILNTAFSYKGFPFDQKVIFFASSQDIDGVSTGETELVLAIADAIGKENLLVKMHPRDMREVYQEHGIEVMRDSFIPWEVYQVNEDLTNRIFLTATSGSFLSMTALLGFSQKGIFINPESMDKSKEKNYNSVMAQITPIVQKLHRFGRCEEISILSKEDAIEQVRYFLNGDSRS